jgi:hypothetical protein
MKQLSHKSLNVSASLSDLTQEQLEKFQELLGAGDEIKSAAAVKSLVVRAAIEAGFLTGVEKDMVRTMKPAAVAWLTQEILDYVKSEQTVPNP